MTTEIPKSEWKEFFSNLSRSLEGWETKVELIDPEFGSQTLSSGLPLSGLTLDERHDLQRIQLVLGTDPDSHLAHTVELPEKVMFEAESVAEGGVLNIEDKEGTKTLVTFAQALPVAVDHGRTQIVSVGQ